MRDIPRGGYGGSSRSRQLRFKTRNGEVAAGGRAARDALRRAPQAVQPRTLLRMAASIEGDASGPQPPNFPTAANAGQAPRRCDTRCGGPSTDPAQALS